MSATATMVFTFIFSFCEILCPFFHVSPLTVGRYFSEWSPQSEYRLEDTAVIEKNPDEDFVILNLTDVQLTDIESCGEDGRFAELTIAALVEKTQPDLITVTGDNAWGTVAYIKLIDLLESFEIPWAPIMGNHDGQHVGTEAWAAYRFMKAEHCLFEFGPEDMGYGNYIVNVTENGKLVHSVIMMDSHDDDEFTREDGSTVSGYDHVWQNQIEWYRWAINGAEKVAGEKVESSLFFHIPLCEYKDAYDMTWDTENVCFKDEYAKTCFGVNHEEICCSPVNNGFFAAIKELGSTKNVVCGHDHVNNSSILYEGVRLTYGLKTGKGCYWEPELNGGTTLTVGSDETVVEHIFIDAASLGFTF